MIWVAGLIIPARAAAKAASYANCGGAGSFVCDLGEVAAAANTVVLDDNGSIR
jgi:hypothetical protein